MFSFALVKFKWPGTKVSTVHETWYCFTSTCIATHRITLSIFLYQLYLGIFEDSIKGYNRTCGLFISPASPLRYFLLFTPSCVVMKKKYWVPIFSLWWQNCKIVFILFPIGAFLAHIHPQFRPETTVSHQQHSSKRTYRNRISTGRLCCVL